MNPAELSYFCYVQTAGHRAATELSLAYGVPLVDLLTLLKATYTIGFISGEQNVETRRLVQQYLAEVN